MHRRLIKSIFHKSLTYNAEDNYGKKVYYKFFNYNADL